MLVVALNSLIRHLGRTSTKVNPTMGDTNVITCTWRLSGKVKIGPGDGLTIKPYNVCLYRL